VVELSTINENIVMEFNLSIKEEEETEFEKYSIKELKALCKKENLPISGNKSILVERLKATKN
jgi:hypothetical protein